MEEIGVVDHPVDHLVNRQRAWDPQWPKDKGHQDLMVIRHGLHILSSTK